MTSATANLFTRIRGEICEMLGLDSSLLTPADSVKVDRGAALRLELDRILAFQMQGQPIDVSKFTTASEQLEQMLAERSESPWDLSRLTEDELETLSRLMQKATGQTLEIEAAEVSRQPSRALSLEEVQNSTLSAPQTCPPTSNHRI